MELAPARARLEELRDDPSTPDWARDLLARILAPTNGRLRGIDPIDAANVLYVLDIAVQQYADALAAHKARVLSQLDRIRASQS